MPELGTPVLCIVVLVLLVLTVAVSRYGDQWGLGSGDGAVTRCTMRGRNQKSFLRNGERADMEISRGTVNVLSDVGEQKTVGRLFLTGSDDAAGTAVPGTSVEEVLTYHNITIGNNNDFRGFGRSRVDLELVNYSNVQATVRIYVLRARIDNESDSAAGQFDPTTFWQNCANNFDEANDYPITIPGNTPYKAPGFGRYFHIVKDRVIKLSAGGHHKLSIHSIINRDLSYGTIGASVEQTDPHHLLKDITYGFMFTVLGTPLPAAAANSIDYSICRVGGIWTFQNWSWTVMHQAINRLQMSNTLDPRLGSADLAVVDETGALTVVDVL